MRVIAIGGYPGVGKSHLMRMLIKELCKDGVVEDNRHGMDMSHFMVGKSMIPVTILGPYKNDEKFPGTDRFSMAIQPKFETYLKESIDKDFTIIFEGDRLFNGKTIKFLSENKISYKVCMVVAHSNLINQRNEARSHQNPSWRQGRQTKVDNIWKQIPESKRILLFNNDEHQSNNSVEILRDVIGDPKWTS